MSATTTLCLAGGNALGAYAAGAVEALLQAGHEPDAIVGTSAGALIGAILAGNRPEQRLPRLRAFWQMASSGGWPASPLLRPAREALNAMHAVQAFSMGRPGLFRPKFPGLMSLLPGMPPDVALFDGSPMTASIHAFVDFDWLNRDGPPLTVCCVDLETGAPVLFSNRGATLRPEHLQASAALLPAFQPVQIEGRWIGDGGLIGNLPLEPALEATLEKDSGDQRIVAIDLFSGEGPMPRSLDGSIERAQDILFSAQTRRAIAAFRREHALRHQCHQLQQLKHSGAAIAPLAHVDLLLTAYRPPAHELGAKTLDFSTRSIEDRWTAGHQGMSALLQRYDARTPDAHDPGLDFYLDGFRL